MSEKNLGNSSEPGQIFTNHSKDDFVEPASNNRYQYPFVEGESIIKGLHNFREKGFSLQTEIDKVKGTVLEIGGPTLTGFSVLNGITFPNRPIISNIGSTQPGTGFESLSKQDKLHTDILADGAQLPFDNETIGVLLISCIDIMDKEKINSYAHNTTKDLNAIHTEEYEKIIRKLEAGARPEEITSDEAFEHMNRARILIEAKRVIKPGGILILKGPTVWDIEIAKILGFEIKEHSDLRVPRQDKSGEFEFLTREIIFQLK